ncbi:hypothetical protein J4447_04885 [Candidatus Pacearchaeota archaeon]|nr:hypothetical protein [Candidatus Pacearchaeota archaeon]
MELNKANKDNKESGIKSNKESNAFLYGILAGLALLLFYLGVLSLFQSFQFALSNLRSLWYFILPLAVGFGTQIGLYFSIRHSATVNATAVGTGGVSAGSMIACCSHFLLNLIPITGLSGISMFLMAYQKQFLTIGIVANVIGIYLMFNHRRKMKGDAH